MLDNIEAIREADKLGVLAATEMLWRQCRQAWDETKPIELPDQYRDVRNVSISGMGGSHLGAQLIMSVFREDIKVPLSVQNQYSNPGYIDQHSLVIATSFSGTTEEVISFLNQAIKRKAKVICISAGGELEQLAKDNNLPHYVFESTYNPSKIPRYGSGYLFMSQLSFLAKAGVLEANDQDVENVIDTLKSEAQKYTLEVKTDSNPAKQLAQAMYKKVSILVASEHLIGSAYIFKNQINESAKNFAAMFEIPELNHHLLEGLKNPEGNKEYLQFVFFESDLYFDRVQKRQKITQDIVDKHGIGLSRFKSTAKSALQQAFETLSFTSYAAFYLSVLNQVDPGPNPWVDYLKEELGQPLGK